MVLDKRKNKDDVKNWMDLLPAMEGKRFNINGSDERILHHYFEEGVVFVKTDKQIHRIEPKKLRTWMELTMPVIEEAAIAPTMVKNGIQPTIFTELTKVMLDNIEAVKNNPDYIPQAQAINNSVKQVTQMVKTQLDYVRLMHNIKE